MQTIHDVAMKYILLEADQAKIPNRCWLVFLLILCRQYGDSREFLWRLARAYRDMYESTEDKQEKETYAQRGDGHTRRQIQKLRLKLRMKSEKNNDRMNQSNNFVDRQKTFFIYFEPQQPSALTPTWHLVAARGKYTKNMHILLATSYKSIVVMDT